MNADEYKATCQRLDHVPKEVVARFRVARHVCFAYQFAQHPDARWMMDLWCLIKKRPERLLVQLRAVA
ncbi:hypothetical protein [Rhodopila globiformis]|uniref:Uncharacterized protein n=1 Tax=Rhodopila globiformis TaxID=1071 RepID=A0A2S6NKE4_RHOGL|nr:hypothetical protein [Rhodopila globiformis]PPQ35427.1 hypothetical protein CCS01_07500 [Rhodopila globiformis]